MNQCYVGVLRSKNRAENFVELRSLKQNTYEYGGCNDPCSSRRAGNKAHIPAFVGEDYWAHRGRRTLERSNVVALGRLEAEVVERVGTRKVIHFIIIYDPSDKRTILRTKPVIMAEGKLTISCFPLFFLKMPTYLFFLF